MRVFFHEDQLNHKPLYEWAFGEKIAHPETTQRAESILNALKEEPLFEFHAPTSFPLKLLKETHNKKLIDVIRSSSALPLDQTFYPSVFPFYRKRDNLDTSNIHHAGAFCFDSGTPLNATTYAAAAWSAACAADAAEIVSRQKVKYSYALCRPPGHHASKDLFGGYCYFNNAAIAAKQLRKVYKKVVILDIDFHHGNGTQILFERDPSVLFISLHGDPNSFYPYFSGFRSEVGSGAGTGFTINFPLEGGIDGSAYMKVLKEKVLKSIHEFEPDALVISAGFDTYVADPVGSFCLETNDFFHMGEVLRSLKLPTVIIQEGGYESTSLGTNVRTFLEPYLNK